MVPDRPEQFPAVALLGPRQVGKTTLAELIASVCTSVYLDLKSPTDRNKLADPALYLSEPENRFVILDEVHWVPELFQTLRGLIDQGRRRGHTVGRFLLLGSASMDLLQQAGENLAGAYVDLPPLNVLEVAHEAQNVLWLRGGFPESFLASNNGQSLTWRENFIRSYLERDIPDLGPRIPAETLYRFWTMLAHGQGGLLNAAQLARSLAVDGKTITKYLDRTVDLLLVRRLHLYHVTVRKRLVKAPKVYVRDRGMIHALLGIGDREALLGHPVVGTSWAGFVIENLIHAVSPRVIPNFYRTAAGAEIDLVLEFPGGKVWAIAIKYGLAPRVSKGFHHARADIHPARSFILYGGTDRYPIANDVEAIGLHDVAQELHQASGH